MSVIVERFLLRRSYLVLHIRRQSVEIADRLELNVVRVNFFQLGPDEPLEHLHQPGDLGLWPFPVLGRECVERDGLYTEPRTRVDDRPNRIGTGAVAENSRLAPQLCPAAVAVHDDGDMLRHAFGIDRRQQFGLGRIWFDDALKILEHLRSSAGRTYDRVAIHRPVDMRIDLVCR